MESFGIKQEFIRVDDSEVDDLIFRLSGVHYYSGASEEWRSGAYYIFNVISDDTNSYLWDDLLAGKNMNWMLRGILDYLCSQGHIESGSYLIGCN